MENFTSRGIILNTSTLFGQKKAHLLYFLCFYNQLLKDFEVKEAKF